MKRTRENSFYVIHTTGDLNDLGCYVRAVPDFTPYGGNAFHSATRYELNTLVAKENLKALRNTLEFVRKAFPRSVAVLVKEITVHDLMPVDDTLLGT